MHPLRHSLDVGSLGPHTSPQRLFTIRIYETAVCPTYFSTCFPLTDKQKFKRNRLKARSDVLRPRQTYIPRPQRSMLGQPREGRGGSLHPLSPLPRYCVSSRSLLPGHRVSSRSLLPGHRVSSRSLLPGSPRVLVSDWSMPSSHVTFFILHSQASKNKVKVCPLIKRKWRHLLRYDSSLSPSSTRLCPRF